MRDTRAEQKCRISTLPREGAGVLGLGLIVVDLEQGPCGDDFLSLREVCRQQIILYNTTRRG